jgi:hypothetical protein
MNVLKKTTTVAAAAALALILCASVGQAALVNLGPGAFTPLAPQITFSEVALGTVNPVYNFAAVPTLGSVTVSFRGNFVGQAAGGGSPVTLTDHTPTVGSPLTLDAASPNTVTVNDGAPGATSPVLSGSPTFNGPISMLFSTPVAGVGLKGGYFDALNSTTIEAYDAMGNVLGSITNSVTGFEFYGLADASGANVIAGISFFITGPEPMGFQIDNVTFGAQDVINPTTPEPHTLVLLGFGLAGLALALKGRSNA